MSVETFIGIDILTTAKQTLQQPNPRHDEQFPNNYQPEHKDAQGKEVPLIPLLPKDAGEHYIKNNQVFFLD